MVIKTLLNLFTKKNTSQNELVETSPLTQSCILYLKGNHEDEAFSSHIEQLSQKLNISKYEVVEYLLDQQEARYNIQL